MKIKWYLSTLVVSLIFWGIYHNQISLVNQEISVQFNIDEVTTAQTQETIADIKKQLQASGVENIQVRTDSNGTLKISYYSDSDVQSIKKILSEDDNVVLDYHAVNQASQNDHIPLEKKNKNYNLNIYEIHKKTTDNPSSAGTVVLNVKQDFDRLAYPNGFLNSNEVNLDSADGTEQQAFKVNRDIAISIETTSNAIPEVRAGPSTFWKVMVFMN